MIKLGDSKKTRFFFDKYNMMLERSSWGDNHIGDALWRTSLMAIATGKEELIEAIKKCITINNWKYGFIRHPELAEDDCSRDQAIPALIALKLHDPGFYYRVISNLSFIIKDCVIWQDAYLWAKEKYGWWRAISFYRFLSIKFEPSYSKHLFCWQIWHSKQSMPLFKWFLLKFIIPKGNYLCRALLGDSFTIEDVKKIMRLRPMIDFRWQRASPWEQGRWLTLEEAEYNTLDLDVLDYILFN